MPEFEDLNDDEFVGFMNSMSDKQKAKYKKLSPDQQRTVRQAHKQKLKLNGAESAHEGDKLREQNIAQPGSAQATGEAPVPTESAAAHNEVIQDTLRGPTTQAKDGTPINQGLGSVEGGDKSITERQAEEAEIAKNTKGPESPVETAAPKTLSDAAVGGTTNGNRDYLTANALATFARNLGKDVGNVAAAYSGGTMNNDRETSLLEQRMAQKAQAETEEQVGKEYSNSRLGQELKANGLDIETQQGRLAMANNVRAALYNKDGSLKYPADSATYRDLATLYGQLTAGGGSRDSILSAISRLGMKGLDLISGRF